MTDALKEHYFRGRVAEGYLLTPEGQVNLHDHVSGRYEIALKHVVPWLQRTADLSNLSLVEVGSGTGSCTLALAQVARSVECFEIHAGSVAVARERLTCWGVDNVRFHETAFDEDSDFVRTGGTADAIVLYATLEHMTHDECLDVLSLAWRSLRPRGLLVVCETPNRFSMIDEHTSWLPFFSQLPRAIQVRYASRSPREEFRWAITSADDSWREDAMTRWGSGISFHEFELAIGDHIHDLIVLDGYEPEITYPVPVTRIDRTLQAIFRRFAVKAHRAFTRRHLYFVVEKR